MAVETVQIVAINESWQTPAWVLVSALVVASLGFAARTISSLVSTIRSNDLQGVEDKFDDLDETHHERHRAVIDAVGAVKQDVERLDRKVDQHQRQNAEEFRALHRADADLRVELADRLTPIEHELGLRRAKGGGA